MTSAPSGMLVSGTCTLSSDSDTCSSSFPASVELSWAFMALFESFSKTVIFST